MYDLSWHSVEIELQNIPAELLFLVELQNILAELLFLVCTYNRIQLPKFYSNNEQTIALC